MDPHILRVKTRQEISVEYGIDRKTLYRWLKRANIAIPSGLIKTGSLRKIYKTFGYP
jgi:DNA invertase Pin-like site-specific DNA recombinase